ncbi:MAG TPA: ABC transporter ATP-binding protein [Marmoricola sp.]|nr:ABC transporter ATP-binding protein [Marmoricola sp.]
MTVPPGPGTGADAGTGAQTAAGTAAIEVSGLRVDRGHRRVLHELAFVVPPGQVTGLLGPSGSGKTTLMRAIVGLQQVASGTVTVLGEPAGSPALRDRVGYVTQAPSVYDDLTVAENLLFFARVLGVERDRARECLVLVGLDGRERDLVGRLSGGERSRVSLAVALLARPPVLVLDEPTVGLDPVLRRDLWNAFHGLADEGVAVLVSSHVMDEASRCDRLLLLRDGRLIADDTPAALLDRTRSADVEAAFLALVERTTGGAP